jgi:hypothetical protein
MRFLIVIVTLLGLSACNGGSGTQESLDNDTKNVPQPSVKQSELQPPKPPSL